MEDSGDVDGNCLSNCYRIFILNFEINVDKKFVLNLTSYPIKSSRIRIVRLKETSLKNRGARRIHHWSTKEEIKKGMESEFSIHGIMNENLKESIDQK